MRERERERERESVCVCVCVIQNGPAPIALEFCLFSLVLISSVKRYEIISCAIFSVGRDRVISYRTLLSSSSSSCCCSSSRCSSENHSGSMSSKNYRTDIFQVELSRVQDQIQGGI